MFTLPKLLIVFKLINLVTNYVQHDRKVHLFRKEVPYSFDPECFQSSEERDVLSYIRTKFVPSQLTCLSVRRKREGAFHKKRIRGRRKEPKSVEIELLKNIRPIDDDVDKEKQPSCEADEGEQVHEGPDLESWLQAHEQGGGSKEMYYSFWRNEGSPESIRGAQGRMMRAFMDTDVDPCADFYQYACGNWEKLNPIPKDKAAYGTFEMLRESLDTVLKDLLTSSIEDQDEAIMKTKLFYQSCMNHKILVRRREKPLLKSLRSLGGWPLLEKDWSGAPFDWLDLVARLRLFNSDILLSEWVGPDIRNSEEYVIQIDQTSLGLPTRDYFLQDENKSYLEAYKTYMEEIAVLLGASPHRVKREVHELVEFETTLATITASPEERRNVSELYQRTDVRGLVAAYPRIDWVRYFTLVLEREVALTEPIVLFAGQYLDDLVMLLDGTEPRIICGYLLWRFVRHRVNNLDDRFQAAKQKFYKVLFGREEAPPRWKSCVAQANNNMGMGLGAMFVRKYFDQKSKNDTLIMTQNIMDSFKRLLVANDWIDDATKALAVEKVNAMMLRIGYPDFILNATALDERYKDVEISPTRYFENTLNILRHVAKVEHDRLGTGVDKTLWNTPPAVVNAYYSRNRNQIMFPAGILQPPFYHRHFPRSLNFGGIGVVIGHEITHGFDDKGRLFDQNGNLHRWWSDAAIESFHSRAQCLIDQYSRYTVAEVAMQIDGVNTQGENIADNGGIKQAFGAYEDWLAENGAEGETLADVPLSHHQLFFLNFAQVWCGTMRPEATRNKLKTAVHSPGQFRVIGTLTNSEEFSRVFNCPVGAPMNPTNKCSVW